uniref:Uncharacterized protein n=1 Tax=Anguilla anguilla TaxID=7936 RepID=A0A0E9R9Y1_ANGAN
MNYMPQALLQCGNAFHIAHNKLCLRGSKKCFEGHCVVFSSEAELICKQIAIDLN